jgi:cytidylate kinase
MMRTRPVVAIDGPAGAGKSTVTRLVADALGYTRVDTGAIYRTVALLCLERGTSLEAAPKVASVARALAAPGALQLATRGPGATVTAYGRDVSTEIRAQEVGQGASRVSALPEVREALLAVQRQLGSEGGVVLEGRDIGTVVFPDAEAKFYLTASVEVRARRRLVELEAKGERASLADIIAEVEERDARDSGRAVAPLRRAEDALLVDSSELDIDQVVALIVAAVRAVETRLAGHP